MKNNTKELISKENLKIKGILFLSNFQNKRFDYSEIDSLFQYNALFPLKDFWKHIILIFTHYYGDPDGKTKEEMRDESNENLSFIFLKLMDKIKEVSTPIKFIELERIYVNIHSRVKTQKHIKDNEEYKKKILEKIYEFSKLEQMYNKMCIITFKNFETNNYCKYLFDAKLELFLDENEGVINKIFTMINMSTNDNEEEKNQVEINMVGCEMNKKGNLNLKKIIKNITICDFDLTFLGGVITAFSTHGELSFIPCPTLSSCLLFWIAEGIYLIIKNFVDVHNRNKIMQEKRMI